MQHWKAALGDCVLDLLHAELDGNLTPLQQEQLQQLAPTPELAQARLRLGLVQQTLQTLDRPTLPQSVVGMVAAQVCQDMATRQSLGPLLRAPAMPHSVAPVVLADLLSDKALERTAGASLPQLLRRPALPPQHSVANQLSARIAAEMRAELPAQLPAELPAAQVSSQTFPPVAAHVVVPKPLAYLQARPADTHKPHNPAPLLLVLALVFGLTLLGLSTAMPNLAAGALVFQALAQQFSPMAGLGVALLLAMSILVIRVPRVAGLRALTVASFALSAVLTLPTLHNLVSGEHGLSIGRDVQISQAVTGNVIVIGGDIHLTPQAKVSGEVVTLLGDVHRAEQAQVGGRVYALLGHAPDDRAALELAPPTGIRLATASAVQPVLGWLGGAAWPQLFYLLTVALLVLLFLTGKAPRLAKRQRCIPVRTLALGVLMMSVVVLLTVTLALTGWLAAALFGAALMVLLTALGLSVSIYDLGLGVGRALRFPHPPLLGSIFIFGLLGLSLGMPLLAFSLCIVGGIWGAGTLVGMQHTESRLVLERKG